MAFVPGITRHHCNSQSQRMEYYRECLETFQRLRGCGNEEWLCSDGTSYCRCRRWGGIESDGKETSSCSYSSSKTLTRLFRVTPTLWTIDGETTLYCTSLAIDTSSCIILQFYKYKQSSKRHRKNRVFFAMPGPLIELCKQKASNSTCYQGQRKVKCIKTGLSHCHCSLSRLTALG